MGQRTWPVILGGLALLLLLCLIPAAMGVRESVASYTRVRELQTSQRELQKTLAAIEQEMLGISILVREYLLEPDASHDGIYRQKLQSAKDTLRSQVGLLGPTLPEEDRPSFDALRNSLEIYLPLVRGLIQSEEADRLRLGRAYLWQQHRPRREYVVAIVEALDYLATRSEQRQWEELNANQTRTAHYLQLAILFAFGGGLLVTLATVARVYVLESRSHAQRDELRSLSAALMNVQEEERKRISRELHDEVGQTLAGLRMELGAIEKLRHREGDGFAAHMGEAKDLAESAVRSVRQIAWMLRPSVLDLGLPAALQSLAREIHARSGVPVAPSVEEGFAALPDAYATCIYRVAQECLTNALRHGRPEHVRLALYSRAPDVLLEVEDDGVGVPAEGANRMRGIGIVGMEERARELGGTLRVAAAPGGGTLVQLVLPGVS